MERFQGLPAATAAHCRAVAAVARQLAERLHAAGVDIDVELTCAAALLHDIARMGKNHAAAGARLLEFHGFTRLAPIVGAHMELDVNAEAPVDEAQVVYLADKLVSGDRRVSLSQRFARKMEKYGQDRQAAMAIDRKRESAQCIQEKIERTTGLPINALTGIDGVHDGETQCT